MSDEFNGKTMILDGVRRRIVPYEPKTCHILSGGQALCGVGMPNDFRPDIWCDAVYWTLHVKDGVVNNSKYGKAVMCTLCVDALTKPPPR